MKSRIETLCEFHTTRSFGNRENLIARSKEANRIYKELSQVEIAELVVRSLEDGEDLGDALVGLACLKPGSLKPFHHRFVETRLFYPGLIYHDADNLCAASLADLIATSQGMLQRNHLLLCMAWAGNAEVQKRFADWRDSPPEWTADLHVPPHAYAQEAGWELLPNGLRRDLFFQTALPLVPPVPSSELVSGLNIGSPTHQYCPWCKRQLVSLLDINSTGDALSFLRLQGNHLRVTTCDVCSAYGVVYSKNDGTGDAEWHPANARPSYLPDDSSEWDTFPERPLALSGERRHFMESASWTNVPGVAFSQIGGLPTWIQDAEYPDCPDCLQKMMFIGQISNEDFDPNMEGIEYCFLCSQCNVTATSYQQS